MTGDRTPTGDLRDQIAHALGQSITQWWQTPPRLDYAADAVLPVVQEALAEQAQTLRAVEIDRDQWRDRAHHWKTAGDLPVVHAWAAQNLTGPASSAPAEGADSAPDGEVSASLRDRLAGTLPCPVCNVGPGVTCLRAGIDNTAPHVTRLQAADAVLPVVQEALAEAERRREQAEALLRELTDTTPCEPHPGNGYCQTHAERPPCPHGEGQRHLAALDAEQPEETP